MTLHRTSSNSSFAAHRSASWPVAAAALAVHVAVTALTWRDLARRQAAEVRGPKAAWRVASGLNTLGSLGYWMFGRVDAPEPIERIPVDECWKLLERSTIGRMAAVRLPVGGHDDGLDIFPVHYLVHDGAVYFRTAPGAKLMEIAEHPTVVFEVDGRHGDLHWSVVVHGEAARLALDDEIEASGVHELVSEHPIEMSSFVRITPRSMTGRRFHRLHARGAASLPTASDARHETPGAQQPPRHGAAALD